MCLKYYRQIEEATYYRNKRLKWRDLKERKCLWQNRNGIPVVFLTFCGMSQRPPGNFKATISSKTLKQSQAKKYTKGKGCEYIGLILILHPKKEKEKRNKRRKEKERRCKAKSTAL